MKEFVAFSSKRKTLSLNKLIVGSTIVKIKFFFSFRTLSLVTTQLWSNGAQSCQRHGYFHLNLTGKSRTGVVCPRDKSVRGAAVPLVRLFTAPALFFISHYVTYTSYTTLL